MTSSKMTLWAVLPWVCWLPGSPVIGQQPKGDELAARVQQLEKRVAELEEIVKQMQTQSKEPGTTATATKLVGNWIVTHEDQETEGALTGLNLKPDGTGRAVFNTSDPQWNNVKYAVVGTQLQLREERQFSSHALTARVRSLTETELILDYVIGGKSHQVRYARDR